MSENTYWSQILEHRLSRRRAVVASSSAATGGQLGPASSSESITGSQKRRKRFPIGVHGPVIVSRSFSSFVSMQRHLPEI